MGSQWHAVCSEYQTQKGGKVVEIKAESNTKKNLTIKEKETKGTQERKG